MQKKPFLIFLLFIIIFFSVAPEVSLAQECKNIKEKEDCLAQPDCAWDKEKGCLPTRLNLFYPSFGGIKLYLGMDINKLVAWFYHFIVGISGLVAFVMLVWGGIAWMTSESPLKIGEAKEIIFSAIFGLIIVLSAYLLIKTINPELTILKLPSF